MKPRVCQRHINLDAQHDFLCERDGNHCKIDEDKHHASQGTLGSVRNVAGGTHADSDYAAGGIHLDAGCVPGDNHTDVASIP